MNKIVYISIIIVMFTFSDNALSEESTTNNPDPIVNTIKGIFNVIEKTAKSIGINNDTENNGSQNINTKEKSLAEDKDLKNEKAKKLAKEKEAAQKLAKEKEAAQKLAKEKEAAQKLVEERETLRKKITIEVPQ